MLSDRTQEHESSWTLTKAVAHGFGGRVVEVCRKEVRTARELRLVIRAWKSGPHGLQTNLISNLISNTH